MKFYQEEERAKGPTNYWEKYKQQYNPQHKRAILLPLSGSVRGTCKRDKHTNGQGLTTRLEPIDAEDIVGARQETRLFRFCNTNGGKRRL